MCMSEFETAARRHANITVVVFNDSSFASQLHHQHRRLEGRVLGTRFLPTDFVAVAAAQGVTGKCLTETDEVHDALAAALKNDGPSVIDARINSGIAPPTWIKEAPTNVRDEPRPRWTSFCARRRGIYAESARLVWPDGRSALRTVLLGAVALVVRHLDSQHRRGHRGVRTDRVGADGWRGERGSVPASAAVRTIERQDGRPRTPAAPDRDWPRDHHCRLSGARRVDLACRWCGRTAECPACDRRLPHRRHRFRGRRAGHACHRSGHDPSRRDGRGHGAQQRADHSRPRGRTGAWSRRCHQARAGRRLRGCRGMQRVLRRAGHCPCAAPAGGGHSKDTELVR